MVTVLTEMSATDIQAMPVGPNDNNELWLSATDTAAITGWEMNPEGFRKGGGCGAARVWNPYRVV